MNQPGRETADVTGQPVDLYQLTRMAKMLRLDQFTFVASRSVDLNTEVSKVGLRLQGRRRPSEA